MRYHIIFKSISKNASRMKAARRKAATVFTLSGENLFRYVTFIIVHKTKYIKQF